MKAKMLYCDCEDEENKFLVVKHKKETVLICDSCYKRHRIESLTFKDINTNDFYYFLFL